jgi:hypothetical protein
MGARSALDECSETPETEGVIEKVDEVLKLGAITRHYTATCELIIERWAAPGLT